MSQNPNVSEEVPTEEQEESREAFLLRWKALLVEQEANSNRRIRLLSQLWRRNRELGKKIDQKVLNAYLIELIQSATKDARDLYEQSLLVVEALETILDWRDDMLGKVKGPEEIKQELADHLKGKIGPLVEEILRTARKRVDEESKKNYDDYVV
jgi:hypothetical protein